MSALSIAAHAAARTEWPFDVVVASLPESLAPAPVAHPDLVVVRAADLSSGVPAARGVLIVCPEPRGELDSTAGSSGVVVVDRGAAGHPSTEDLRAAVAATGPDALLEIRATAGPGTDVATLMVEMLAVVRVADSPFASGAVARSGRNGATVRGRAASARRVLIDVVLTAAAPSSTTVRAIGAEAMVDARIPSSAAARPAEITVSDAHGARLLPTRWETASRAAARRLCAAAIAPRRPDGAPDELAELRADISAVRELGL